MTIRTLFVEEDCSDVIDATEPEDALSSNFLHASLSNADDSILSLKLWWLLVVGMLPCDVFGIHVLCDG